MGRVINENLYPVNGGLADNMVLDDETENIFARRIL